jgi:beta-1,4-mannosyl-glycoprotein beta-1,4-N-acetylglucosaminyltransferase
MVLDTILFYNELDLLEVRLNILDSVVDKFVIVEATKTFVGNQKPLYFQENKERFAKWSHKIVHYVIDELTDEEWAKAKLSPNVGAGEHWWVREYTHKERMLDALKFCKDDDIIFISDLDELWGPDIKIEAEHGKVYRPIQTAYHYYLNNRSDQDITGWVGTRYATYKTIKEFGINHLRTESMHPSIHIPNGGWHFTFMGGADKIKEKVENYGHQEFRGALSGVETAMSKNVDFLNRGFKLWKDESDLPEYILNNKEKWKKYLL